MAALAVGGKVLGGGGGWESAEGWAAAVVAGGGKPAWVGFTQATGSPACNGLWFTYDVYCDACLFQLEWMLHEGRMNVCFIPWCIISN